MDGEVLVRILCRLEAGMSLKVTDAWLAQAIPGTLAQRQKRISYLATTFNCALRHGIDYSTFEKIEFPRTG